MQFRRPSTAAALSAFILATAAVAALAASNASSSITVDAEVVEIDYYSTTYEIQVDSLAETFGFGYGTSVQSDILHGGKTTSLPVVYGSGYYASQSYHKTTEETLGAFDPPFNDCWTIDANHTATTGSLRIRFFYTSDTDCEYLSP